MEQQFSGVVVRATGSWYEVLHEGERLRCRIRGRLRLKGIRSTNPVVVGDRVMVEPDGDSSAPIATGGDNGNCSDSDGQRRLSGCL